MLDRAAVLLPVLLASLVLLPGCSKKPSEEQCDQFATHLVKLLEDTSDVPDSRVKQLARTYQDKIVEACLTKGTVAEVECVLAQASLADVETECK